MEKVFKIIVITAIVLLLYMFPYWSIALFVALICVALSVAHRFRGFLLLLPMLFIIIAVVDKDYPSLCLWCALLYWARCVIKQINLQGIKNIVASAFLLISLLIFLPQLYVLGLLLLVFSLPIVTSKQWLLPRCGKIIFVAVMTIITLVLGIISYNENVNERRVAYLSHGVWCRPSPQYKLDSLNNSKAYSYSELCSVIGADTISNLSQLGDYNELWIMTPTKPFTDEEKKIIMEWVLHGGSLIVATDHTDLYGHGRVSNDLIQAFGVEVNYTSVFSTKKASLFRNSVARLCPLKTSNSIEKISMGFPLLSTLLWEERAYYDNDNFFGPLEANANNEFDMQNIVSSKAYGLGRITIVTDTTYCANFAVYQPFVREFISYIVSFHVEIWLMILIPIWFICVLLLADHRGILYFSSLLIMIPLAISMIYGRSLNEMSPYQLWCGNHQYVSENLCPFACISTAYSLSPLSGKVPLWKEKIPNSESDVIWVDTIPPPNPNWRWIHVSDDHNHFYANSNHDRSFDELYEALGALEVESYDSVFNDFAHLDVLCVFNDAVMNDWWYGNFGLSETRTRRIEAWLCWLNKGKTTQTYKEFRREDFTKDLHTAILNVHEKPSVQLMLPMPVLSNGSEVNFGCGIIGKVLKVENGRVEIIGFHEFSENWDCPRAWSLHYQ